MCLFERGKGGSKKTKKFLRVKKWNFILASRTSPYCPPSTFQHGPPSLPKGRTMRRWNKHRIDRDKGREMAQKMINKHSGEIFFPARKKKRLCTTGILEKKEWKTPTSPLCRALARLSLDTPCAFQSCFLWPWAPWPPCLSEWLSRGRPRRWGERVQIHSGSRFAGQGPGVVLSTRDAKMGRPGPHPPTKAVTKAPWAQWDPQEWVLKSTWGHQDAYTES